ncbi:MAG: hypothetical protein ACT4PZ_03750 [Panacagrimonas sp.]
MTTALGIDVLLTALLSAALTWAAAFWFYKRRLSSELQRTIDEIQVEFEQRVKAGVLAAGEELLPQFREQVKLGFQDALRETQTGELVENYAAAVNLGTGLVSNRLGNLFGIKPKK